MALAAKNSQIKLEDKFRLMEWIIGHHDWRTTKELMAALNTNGACGWEHSDHSHIQRADPVSAMNCGLWMASQLRAIIESYRLDADKTHNGAGRLIRAKSFRRRYTRLLKGRAPLPDLILMDGGEIEMNAAKDVWRTNSNLDIPRGRDGQK